MAILISLALLFVVAKDVVYLGALSDSLRIGTLGLAGAVGAMFAFGPLARGVTCYLPLLLYCAWCVVPIVYADDTRYLLYQILSLLCVVAAGIGAFGGSAAENKRTLRALGLTLVWTLAISMALNIAALWLWPARAWEYPAGDVRRFRGVMSEPGMVAVCAGLLVGFAWAMLRNPVIRIPLVALGVVCLVLTGSRTPFVAMLLAAMSVAAVHKSAKTLVVAGIGAAAVIGMAMAAGAHVDRSTVDRAVRANSLTTMSGRLELWQHGWELGQKQPVFGRGLTLGSEALTSDGSFGSAGGGILGQARQDGRDIARATFHNGYLQSFMDSGLVGAFLYLMVIGAATWHALTSQKSAESGVILYTMIFLAVTNLGQNAVQGPANVYGMVFWLLAAAAAALPRKQA